MHILRCFSVKELQLITDEQIADYKAIYEKEEAFREKERLERIEYSEYFHAKQRKLQYEKLKIEFE